MIIKASKSSNTQALNKNILIINCYASTPKYGGGMYRHFYFAKEFNNLGYKTDIISGSFSHLFVTYPAMENKIYKKECIDGVNFVWIKTMTYKNSFDKKRVASWFEFIFKLLFVNKYLSNKPDIILCSPTEVLSIIPAYILSKKYNAKLIFEVRDIWPLTLIQIGNISPKHPFIKLLSWVEKFAINKADIIVSNLSNYAEHLYDLGIYKNVNWISNGINLSDIKKQEPISDTIKNMIPKNKFIVGYTGKLGISNAMIYLIEAAKILIDTDIVFVIIGDGQEKNNLINHAKNLNNVIFIESIPKDQIQSILKLFDVCYIGWLSKDIYKFGIAANKIYDYMYSEKPILQSINTKNNIVELSQCGICVDAESSSAIATGIQDLYKMSREQRDILGKNGKKYVKEYCTYEKLAQKYIDIFKEN